jgi:hypothetical protein
MSNQITLWQGKAPVRVPANATTPEQVLKFADSHQLSIRDRNQITSAFANGQYDMVSSWVWGKALSSLKAQLGKLGTPFIAEMLDRPDIDGSLSIDQVLTDFEALRLARELGVITGTGALRLRQSLELLTHFGQMPTDEDEGEMSAVEAIRIVTACVENILGQAKIEAALDFKTFRDSLETEVFSEDDAPIQTLIASPYFFQRASVRILLALIKSRQGAQLENTLGNANLIIPLLWKRLLGPDRFQIGRAYAEVTSEGRATAAAGLKKALLQVKGFDFVPEDLRSVSFIKAANALLAAHEGMNNFYNEPGPAKHLEEMGTAIPRPAFPVCMTAVLSVKLGNFYSICFAAQKYADAILERVSENRWLYFLNECLKTDDRILSKLLDANPRDHWSSVVTQYDLARLIESVTDPNVRQLLQNAEQGKRQKIETAAKRLINKLGYTDD